MRWFQKNTNIRLSIPDLLASIVSTEKARGEKMSNFITKVERFSARQENAMKVLTADVAATTKRVHALTKEIDTKL